MMIAPGSLDAELGGFPIPTFGKGKGKKKKKT